MECGWGSPEEVAVCIHIAKRWFDVLVDLSGLGSLALITLLIWLFGRLRKDLSKWEAEAAREKELRVQADNIVTEAVIERSWPNQLPPRRRKIGMIYKIS
jgi:hypothetical protein